MFTKKAKKSVKTISGSTKEGTDLINDFKYAEFEALLDNINESVLSGYDFRGQENLSTIREALSRKDAQLFIPIFIIFKMRGAKLNKILSDPDLRSKVSPSTTALKVFIPDTNSLVRRPPAGHFRLQSIALAFPHLMSMVSFYLEENFPDRIFKSAEFSDKMPFEYRWPGSLVVFWSKGTSGELGLESNMNTIASNIRLYNDYIEKFIEVRRRTTEITEKQILLTKINLTWLGRLLEHYSYTSLQKYETDNSAPKTGNSWDDEKKKSLCNKLGINLWAQIARPTNFNNVDDLKIQVNKMTNGYSSK